MAMKKSEFKDCDIYAARIAALRPFPKETLKSLRDYYRVGLTYTSNALEGNSLTESETKVVIEDGLTIGGKPLRDVYEATGHAKAYDFLYKLTKEELMPAIRNPKYDEAVKLYEMGFSIRDIASYFHLSHQTVWKALKRRITLREQKQAGQANIFYRGGISSDKRAHDIVDNAIRYGKLINPHVCECCGCVDTPHKNGASDIQAHHDDYNFPLKVRWLCQKCHFEWHKVHKAKEVVIDEEIFNEPSIDIIYGGFPC